MAYSMRSIMNLVIALVIISVVVPLGFGAISTFGDTYVPIGATNQTVTDWGVHATVITLVETLLPIMGAISLVVLFLPGVRKKWRGR